ncbi:MAG: cysteine desulfurase family protein [Bacilli bacterium]|nr:cysteine desulfurase family protein [Bacilli bacterium]
MKYFDYTATTPVDSEVLETYIKVQNEYFANTTSLHSLGQKSNAFFEKAREEIKEILDLKSHELVFTSNATEANNLAIYGIAKKYPQGKLITTKIEHPSVYEVFKSLEKEGYEVIYLDVDEKGIIDLNQLARELNKDTILVSIMWVNNITGTIEPIKEVIRMIREYPKIKLHVDIVQGLAKVVPNFAFKDIDLLTVSAHKIYGLKGIGGLFYRSNIDLSKRLFGSSAQYKVKPGTLDLALVVSMCKAIKKFYPLTEKHYEYVKELNCYLRKQLESYQFIVINSPIEGSPYILNVSFPGINGETIVHTLEAKEIYVSTGSACSSKIKKPEKTIYSMTKSEILATTTIRISLSHLVTYADIDYLINAIGEIKNV